MTPVFKRYLKPNPAYPLQVVCLVEGVEGHYGPRGGLHGLTLTVAHRFLRRSQSSQESTPLVEDFVLFSLDLVEERLAPFLPCEDPNSLLGTEVILAGVPTFARAKDKDGRNPILVRGALAYPRSADDPEGLDLNPAYPLQAACEVVSAFVQRDGSGAAQGLTLQLLFQFLRRRHCRVIKQKSSSTVIVPDVELVKDSIVFVTEIVGDRMAPFASWLGDSRQLVGQQVHLGGIPTFAREVVGKTVIQVRGSVAYPTTETSL